jgi:hypothetical protein
MMASKPILPTSTSKAGPTQTTSDPKARGGGAIRRTSKAAHKLKVLPEHPDPPTQSKIASEEDEDGGDEEGDATGSTSEVDDDDDEVEVCVAY